MLSRLLFESFNDLCGECVSKRRSCNRVSTSLSLQDANTISAVSLGLSGRSGCCCGWLPARRSPARRRGRDGRVLVAACCIAVRGAVRVHGASAAQRWGGRVYALDGHVERVVIRVATRPCTSRDSRCGRAQSARHGGVAVLLRDVRAGRQLRRRPSWVRSATTSHQAGYGECGSGSDGSDLRASGLHGTIYVNPVLMAVVLRDRCLAPAGDHARSSPRAMAMQTR